MKLKRYSAPGEITRGSCTLIVEASSLEEAAKKFLAGEWTLEPDSEDWECEIDGEPESLKDMLELVEEIT